MPSEGNLLINPAHPEIARVHILEVVKYTLDQRLRP
jgi:hypothetical protein